MERLESLGNAISQITMYDIKSMYNQAKNVVLNVSETEAKVRDATNDEPWGASSTLMQEIAQGTYNFQNFNEIMPSIYARFMEKEARQWRQIYKALQLLEYLVKNGSERVVDDARSHIATIKMLRNFYYIDDKGKDQGLNVRNRSRELVELLGDVEKIRTERRKAKANKHKYTGTGNEGFGFGSGGSRYGGFGSESVGYGGSSSSGYGGGGNDVSSSRDYNDYSSGGSGGFRDSNSRRNYEEYDAGDDDTTTARRSNSLSISGSVTSPAPRRSAIANATPTATPRAPEPAPIVDLLGLDDDFGAPAAAPVATNKALPLVAAASLDNDDEFGGFQDAPSPVPASTNFFTPAPAAAAPSLAQPVKPMSPPLVPQTQIFQQQAPARSNNLFSMLAPTTASPPPMGMATNRPPSYMKPTAMSAQNPMFSNQSIMTPSAIPSRATPVSSPGLSGAGIGAKPKTASSGFDDLWTMSLGSSTSKPSTPTSAGPAKSMKDLEKEKAQAGIWGSGQGPKSPMGAGFGSFGGASGNTPTAPPPSSSNNGFDDLLF